MAVKKILFAKVETTEGTDIFGGVPTDGASVIETIDLQVQRYEGNKIEKNVDRQLLGNNEQVNVSPYASVSCGVYATGFGTAGTAALYDALLRACAMARTDKTVVDDGVASNVYDLADEGHEAVSLYDYIDDIDLYQLITGAKGSVAFSGGSGELFKFQFSNLMGNYTSPQEGNSPAISAAEWDVWIDRPTLPVGITNTTTCTLDGYAMKLSSVNVDWGLDVKRLDLPNYRATEITDRAQTGSFTFLAPTLTEKNFFTKLESHAGISKVAFSLIHGATAGDIVELGASEFQIGNISHTEIEGKAAFTIDGSFIDSPIITIR